MSALQRTTAHAAALLCAASLSCSSPAAGPADLTGRWEGVLGDPAGGELLLAPATFFVVQHGDRVVGTFGEAPGGPEPVLVGAVDGDTLSFTLEYASGCTIQVAGAGTVERRSDRDRLDVTFRGTSTCVGAIEGTGRLDRLRCPASMSACLAGYAEDLTPWCADLANDPANCGICALRCDGALQVCASGQCQVPACSGPVPLEAPLTTSTGDHLWALVLGDVDGDGDADAVLPGVRDADGERVVAVLLNDGRGALSAGPDTILSSLFPPGPISMPSAVAVGDLDGDGHLDLAAYAGAEPFLGGPRRDRYLLTLLGNGDGTFRAGERFPAVENELRDFLGSRLVAIADLDGDGFADVAARSGVVPAVQVRLGRGDGTLGPAVEYAVAGTVAALAVADLDGDGHVDLVAASDLPGGPPASRVVSVLLGKGDGTFAAALESAGVPYPHDVAVADLDENGVPDLALTSSWEWASHDVPDVAVLIGNGDGTFQAPVAIEEEPWSFAWNLAVSDLDGDGHLDLAVGDDARGLELFLGRGDATFAPFEHPVRGGAGLVAAADLDRDGTSDLVAGGTSGQSVVVLRACRR